MRKEVLGTAAGSTAGTGGGAGGEGGEDTAGDGGDDDFVPAVKKYNKSSFFDEV
jgi:hypothetical protein